MCLSHLIYTVRPCLIHTCHAAPLPFLTLPFFSRPGHSMAVEKELVGYLPVFGFFRLSRARSCNQTRTNLRCRWLVWNQTLFIMDEEKSGSSTLQKRRSVTLLDYQSDISDYHADIHEGHGTAGAGRGRGMACELMHGMAGERQWTRHVMCESALRCLQSGEALEWALWILVLNKSTGNNVCSMKRETLTVMQKEYMTFMKKVLGTLTGLLQYVFQGLALENKLCSYLQRIGSNNSESLYSE